MQTVIVNTKLGSFKIKHKNNVIYETSFMENDSKKKYPNKYISNKVNKYISDKVNKYFNGSAKNFGVRYNLVGTDFQKSVWREIKNIPYGETRTYSEIAESIGQPKSFRAVANACGQNKLAIIIPCHRVVGKNNNGGYEWGIHIKEQLLEIESEN